MKKLEIFSLFIIIFITIVAIVFFAYHILFIKNFSNYYIQVSSKPIDSNSILHTNNSLLYNVPLLIILEPKEEPKPKKPTYYIKVNVAANTVTVYSQDQNHEYSVPVKAFDCSTGTATPHSRHLCYSSKIFMG